MKTANYTDKNMVAGNNPTEGTLWYEVNAKDMDLYGTVEDGGCSLTARIPEDIAKRRDIIKASYERAIADGDKNVYFIDGETLLKGEFEESCTIEGIHPNDIGFLRMSRIIGDKLNEIMNLK